MRTDSASAPRRQERRRSEWHEAAQAEREALLEQVSDLLEKPMLALSLGWLLLVIVDLAGYSAGWMEVVSWGIWGIFVFHFLLEFTIAPKKPDYLRKNWLTALSLLAPALRLLRIARLARLFRAARATRGLRLLRVVSTANRGLRVTRKTLARRGLGYVIALHVLALFLGAGGIYAFERPPEGGIRTYGDALWWTAMVLSTYGGGYEPVTTEGRLLTWLLALFAFSVFGYVTATLASFFIQQDRADETSRMVTSGTAAEKDGSDLSVEIAGLRSEMRELRAALRATPGVEREAGERRDGGA